jgi:ShK domain-like
MHSLGTARRRKPIASTSRGEQERLCRICPVHAIGKVHRRHGAPCSDCANWKDGKACVLNPSYMRNECAKTCGSCKGIDLRVRIPLVYTCTSARTYAITDCPGNCGCNTLRMLEPHALTLHQAQGRITGAITVADSKEFSALYPALATQPVGQSHFRYDPSLSELQQLGAQLMHISSCTDA